MGSFTRRVQAQALDADIVFDAKATIKALNAVSPDLKKMMLRELKKEARPMVKGIRKEIQSLTPPTGSLYEFGRLSWNNGKRKNAVIKPDNVLARFTTGRSRNTAVTSLFAVWVRSPMVAITGVIGKGSMSPRRAVTRDYEWRGQDRRHRVTTQGQGLLKSVRGHGADNWFYKKAEKELPSVEREVKLVWNKYSKLVSRKL